MSITAELQRRKDQSSIHLFMILLTSIKQLATRKFNEKSVDPSTSSHVMRFPFNFNSMAVEQDRRFFPLNFHPFLH